MNVAVIPGGRLLEDEEHAVLRWTSAQGDVLRAVFEREGDEAIFQFVVRETATSDVPLEVGLESVPPALVDQLDQRGYEIAAPADDEGEADAETDQQEATADGGEVFE